MKRLPIKLVLCFLAFVMWNCENHSEILEDTNQVEEVNADNALSQINKSKTYLNQSKSKDFDDIISQINKKKLARKFKSEEQTTNFTFSLKKEKSSLKTTDNVEPYYSDILFVNIDSLNQISYHVFRYIPVKEWLNDSTSNLSTYSGKVQLLTNDKEVLASIDLDNGVQIEKASKAKTEVGECTLVNRVTMCTGSVYPGYETYCTTTYDLYCPSGGGITYPDPTPTNSGDSDTGGGDGEGGDDSGSSTSGSPIIKEERPECTGGKINSVVYPFACVCPSSTIEDVNGDCVEEEIVLDDSFKDNDCLYNVYQKFEQGENTISQYIENFIPQSSVANLNLKTDDNFGFNNPDYSSAGAITSEPDNFMITITFNTDPNLVSSVSNYSSLILGVEFMHEMVHAEMYRKLLSHAQQPDIPWTRSFINNLRNDFEGLADYYTRYWLELPPDQEPTSAQHQLMAEHYVDMMTDALADFDDDQNSLEYYESLSWLGLKETVAWDNLSLTDTISINNNIQNALLDEPCN